MSTAAHLAAARATGSCPSFSSVVLMFSSPSGTGPMRGDSS
eukprot:CAMPEP_0179221736 /NCGR_PEP_ID=MMETSP0797-20121207/6349_1 /TAXON_ID=47934 /ORGANISM="Dinophysis acuminata, Strain DAEP01" /LENGTH=40 /DNA_ID= /DNA_START= /DNA_END= /DNA_ORIENTATION=